jgi:uncharacterized RDD family membrane protein YckC
MEWYYASNGQQNGPVNDSDFQGLVNAGTIQSDTLVWKTGMAEWQPYGSLNSVAAAAPAGGHHTCIECHKQFSPEEMVKYKDQWVCGSCKPLFFQKIQEGAQIKSDLNYASFGQRFAAKILDGLIIGVVFFIPVLIYIILQIKAGRKFDVDLMTPFINIFQFASMVIGIGYTTFFVGKYGATPGKMAMKLKVVTEGSGSVSYARACGRHFAEILSGMICYIGYLMMCFDEEKRTLHDRICNTRVIVIPKS